MAGTVVADTLQADSTSTLVIKNGVANTPPTIQDSAGTQIGTFCRAWVNFNGTGTIAIRASFNVRDITDNGTGDYTVNFINALPDANYVTNLTGTVAASTSVLSIGILDGSYSTRALTGSVRINSYQSSTPTDADYRGVSIFR